MIDPTAFQIISVIAIVAFSATLFILFLNFRYARKNIRSLDFRIISIELLTLTIWTATLTRTFFSPSVDFAGLNLALFILSIIFGVSLIRTVLKEIKTRRMVNELVNNLRIINDRLRQLDRQKSEFVSIASHQLRSPVASIQGYASLILEGDYGDVPEKMREPLGHITDSGKNLSEMINDFLDIVTIEQGALKFQEETFDLLELVKDIKEHYIIQANKKGLHLKSKFPDTSIFIRADKGKIYQSITNILDNSLKYTKEGSITLSLSIQQQKAIILIEDTGIGINKNEQSSLFKKFNRLSNAREIDVSGIGLGLFITKEIIEAHGGNISVESAGSGKGTAFRVELPTVKG